jgi:putative phosphoesterase
MKVAVLSDIHANIYALEAVLSDLDADNVSRILVAGDLIGYYYWPKAVVQKLMNDRRVLCIQGNHEQILFECLSDQSAAARFRGKYGSGYDQCLNELDRHELAWLSAMPESMITEVGGVSFYMRHGSLQSVNEYIYPDADASVLSANHSECAVTIFGHTHYPLIHLKNSQILLNPGSVGQSRDHGGMASYVIYDTRNGALQFRRVRFNVEPVIDAAMERDPGLEYLWKVMRR